MVNDFQVQVNKDVLIWARESIALSRNLASEKTGISSSRLTQLEDGEKQPTLEELKLFSKSYKRTIATLLLSKPLMENPLPKDRRTIDSKEVNTFQEKTIMAVRKARAMTKLFLELKQELGISIPKFNLSANLDEDSLVHAIDIRKLLNLDEMREITDINYALDGYIAKVESLGVSIFQLSLTQDKLRGFSIIDDIIPIIGIKRGGETTTSKIFTLFHELGHLLLNNDGLCDLTDFTIHEIEKWCNAFAAEILIPTSELLQMQIVKEHKKNNNLEWKLKELISLGNHFHVGPLSILRSLLENKLTSDSLYQEKHLLWNRPQFGRSKNPEGRNIAKETLVEKGRTNVSLVFSAFDQNRINIKELSDFLGIRLSYIPKTRQLLYA
jgi:Zn-dependent peptidase ImmA (M78 family)